MALNARTELLAGGEVATGRPSECSVIGRCARRAAGDRAGCWLAQNWDFHPDLASSRVLWTILGEEGRWLTTFTEAGILAKTGISGDGLALALSFLASARDGGVDGLPVHLLARVLLEDCATLDDAERALARARVSASVCLTLAGRDAAGRPGAASYELAPGAVARVDPDAAGYVRHTNHPLAAGGAQIAAVLAPAARAGSESRLARLEAFGDRSDASDGAAPVSALLELLADEAARPGGEPLHRSEDHGVPWAARCATLATLVYDATSVRMWARFGGAHARAQEVALPPPARRSPPPR